MDVLQIAKSKDPQYVLADSHQPDGVAQGHIEGAVS
jgi:hypothetical protein